MSGFEVTGVDNLFNSLDKFADKLEKAAHKAAKKGGAILVQADAVKSIMRGSPQGVTYKKYRPNRKHKASAAGQAPASDTGRLAGSIGVIDDGKNIFVGTNLKHAKFLEFGTQDLSARPFLFPAFEKNKKQIIKMINLAGQKTIRGAGE